MPRTNPPLEVTDDELAAQLEQITVDPTDLRDASALRAISAAVDVAQAAERSIIDAVAGARAAGWSWTDIGITLGVTRQAARQRFAEQVERVAS